MSSLGSRKMNNYRPRRKFLEKFLNFRDKEKTLTLSNQKKNCKEKLFSASSSVIIKCPKEYRTRQNSEGRGCNLRWFHSLQCLILPKFLIMAQNLSPELQFDMYPWTTQCNIPQELHLNVSKLPRVSSTCSALTLPEGLNLGCSTHYLCDLAFSFLIL